MATLIRKVWDSVVPGRKNSTSESSSSSSGTATSSLGAFDPIPTELLMQILRLVGPKEAARLSVVCKAWRSLVADDELWIFFWRSQQQQEPRWESVKFSETYLRSGQPIQSNWREVPRLRLMSIYGHRAQGPRAFIIDGGSGYCKFGWSKYACPSGRSATFLEFGNVESPMYSRLRHFFGTIYSRYMRTELLIFYTSLIIMWHADS